MSFELCAYVDIQRRDQRSIESYELLWLDTVCQQCADRSKLYTDVISPSLSSITSHYSDILSIDYFTFTSLSESPITVWTLLSPSDTSRFPVFYDLSCSLPSVIQLISLLKKLDDEVESTYLLFFCDCCQFIKDISYQEGLQIITYQDPTSDSMQSISLHLIHLHLLPRPAASSFLPTYRGLSPLFRILF